MQRLADLCCRASFLAAYIAIYTGATVRSEANREGEGGGMHDSSRQAIALE
jgi:hypothetical protein